MTAQLGSLLHLGFGVTLLWLLVYVGVRPYRIDRVRNELFAIRNQLFLFAARGGISFDDPAYTLLANRINAVIRFAHTITFTQLILYSVNEKLTPTPGLVEQERKFAAAIADLPEGAKATFTAIHQRSTQTIALHMIFGSPVLLLVTGLSLPFFKIKQWLAKQKESSAATVSKEFPVTLIEEQAAFAQKREAEESCYEVMQHA